MKRQPLTEEQLIARDRARREARASFQRLTQHYSHLRTTLRAEAITAMWFLFGDEMFEGIQCDSADSSK